MLTNSQYHFLKIQGDRIMSLEGDCKTDCLETRTNLVNDKTSAYLGDF